MPYNQKCLSYQRKVSYIQVFVENEVEADHLKESVLVRVV